MASKNDFCKDDHYFSALVDTTPGIIIIVDSEMTILFANSTLRTMLGYDPDSLTGKKIQEFIHADDSPILMDATAIVYGRWESQDDLSSG